MKILRVLPWVTLTGLIFVGLFMINELNNPEVYRLSFSFTSYVFTVDVWGLLILAIILIIIILMVNFACYQLLLKVLRNNQLHNSSTHLILLFLKYVVPVFILCTLAINGHNIIQSMHATTFAIRILFSCALVLDSAAFIFSYGERAEIRIKFYKWNFYTSMNRVIKITRSLIWTIATLTLNSPVLKTKQNEKKILHH
jgi:hypothetical protein